MEELLNKIDGYLSIQEEKERIDESLQVPSDLKEVIEFVKNSPDMNKALNLLEPNVKKEIEKLIDGGLI
jgi:hypothetical protein